jgi:tripartite-type tricarboxylate transporter receptor subunit TctC
MVLLGKRAGVDLVHVPYRGGAPAMNDVVAGHVDLLNGSAALLTPQIAAGKIRPLFQMGSTRLAALHDVPTIGEAGYPGAQAMAWWALYAPGRTPKPIIERFRTAFVAACTRARRPPAHRDPADEPRVVGTRRAAQVRQRTVPHLGRGRAREQHQRG